MVFSTHVAAAVLGAELVLIASGQPLMSREALEALAGAALVGPLADIDHPQSYIGRKLWPVSYALNAVGIRHRTLTHSLLFLVFLFAVLQLLPLPAIVKLAIWTGYATHPLIDLLNPQGVVLFWPYPARIRLLPEMLSIPVQSFAESVFRLGVSALIAFLFVRNASTSLPIEQLQGLSVDFARILRDILP